MENRGTKIKSVLIILLAWLIALALLYVVMIKLKFFFR
jgi:hypothetical protein